VAYSGIPYPADLTEVRKARVKMKPAIAKTATARASASAAQKPDK